MVRFGNESDGFADHGQVGEYVLLRLIPNSQLLSYCGKTWIGGPHLQPPYQGGGQQMDIDPAYAPAIQIPFANEPDDFIVWNRERPMNTLVGGK